MNVAVVDMLTSMIRGGMSPKEAYRSLRENLGDELAKQAILEFEKRTGRIRQLKDPLTFSNPGTPAWYAGPQEGDRCWPALRTYLLAEKRWPEATVDSIDQASTKVLSHMQPPGYAAIDTRGLVVGYVQSGKTANYTALIAKAADVGYRLFIVLAGIHNGLRAQTQRRLEAELLHLNGDLWATLTSDVADFRASVGNTAAFLTDQNQTRILCVVKKNAHVLRRLRKWLEKAPKSVLASCPTLIIDDEADQAGLNSAKDPEERTVINRLILETLDALPKAAWVGYTATPFANVLVHPDKTDLYPKDFIVALPRPAGYFGAETLFGRERLPQDEDDPALNAEVPDMIREVPEDDVPLVRPRGRNDLPTFEPDLAPSLDRALRYFLMASAARRVRKQDDHSSMLVHTTLYADAQEELTTVVRNAWSGFKTNLKKARVSFLTELEAQWNEECAAVPAEEWNATPVPFEKLVTHFEDVIGDPKSVVITENGRSLDRLVYDEESRVQIAVGGNTLSRGLTLEGLVVSYFVRSAGAYDTLLQMGRWFGYRFGYADLPRVWMTAELQSDFRDLATVEQEIRYDIAHYESENLTPTQFAVRIRTHPTLAVTSRLKMRDAVNCDISFEKTTRQTVKFAHRDAATLAGNLNAASRLVKKLGEPTKMVVGRRVWEKVDVGDVLDFVGNYQFHEAHKDLDGEMIQKYVRAQNAKGELGKWTVVLASLKKPRRGTRTIGGVEVHLLDRSRHEKPTEFANLGVITTQSDLLIGVGEGRTLKDGRSAEEGALLVLYPIAKKSSPPTKSGRATLDAADDVLGVAFSFPASKHPTPQRYVRAAIHPEYYDEEETYEDEEAPDAN